MQTIHRYIFRDYLVSFLMALSVITLVLYLGAIMRGLDYVAQGVPGGILIQIFTLKIPYILTFSIPISTVVSTLLLFGRLSIDGEFTAMRSGGLSTWQIISPVVLGGAIFSLISLLVQYEIAPESRYAGRKALANIGELNPVDLLDEGQFVRFPTLEIYITQKDGNFLEDVEVYQLNENGQTIQSIRARDGEITLFPDEKLMRVKLNKAQVQHPDADNPTDLTMARIIDMETYEFDVDYRDMMNQNKIARSIKDMRGKQLTRAIMKPEEVFEKLDPLRQEKNRMKALVEFHKRIGLGMACLSFTLVGIPLGMTSRRKESNHGIVIGLGIVILFYAFIVTADSLRDLPWLFPDYIIWIPILATQIGGILMIRRIP
ncbi:LptF/LptG family permease [Kiritimatiellaeota bacterium B1221]|nr:LptF/LptG family permease [Kiritimatiellaeota bacterium B1221]